MSTECLFCRIIAGKTPADIVYQDEKVVAFRDIKPAAPIHILIVPRKHISRVYDLTIDDISVMMDLTEAASKIAKMLDTENSFKLVINNGKGAGQHVFHLHMHLLGGEITPKQDDLSPGSLPSRGIS